MITRIYYRSGTSYRDHGYNFISFGTSDWRVDAPGELDDESAIEFLTQHLGYEEGSRYQIEEPPRNCDFFILIRVESEREALESDAAEQEERDAEEARFIEMVGETFADQFVQTFFIENQNRNSFYMGLADQLKSGKPLSVAQKKCVENDCES